MAINERPRDDASTRPTAEANRVVSHIQTGVTVDVWCRSLSKWTEGFVVVDVDHQGWRVRRRSDGSVLPARFPEAEIRVAFGIGPPPGPLTNQLGPDTGVGASGPGDHG